MILIAVFNSSTSGIEVLHVEFAVTSNDCPSLLFCSPGELVDRDEFREYVVRVAAKSFPRDMHEMHTALVVSRNEVVKKWRVRRGHFKDIQI